MSAKKKQGFMSRLFSKMSVDHEDEHDKKETRDEKRDEKKDEKKKKLQRMHTVDPGSLKKEEGERSKKLEKQKSDSAMGSQKPRSQKKGGGKGGKSKRKRGKKEIISIEVDTSSPIEWPTTPEVILAYHRKESFLNQNEDWLVVELNEYECLVENFEIIKIIAKHSKFFEVEPDELWDEFFEFMEEVPTYDEIINYDVWQEFRDEKYPY